MIEYVAGDILGSDAHAVVNPVNCVGVMGKGLTLQFKSMQEYSTRISSNTLASTSRFDRVTS